MVAALFLVAPTALAQTPPATESPSTAWNPPVAPAVAQNTGGPSATNSTALPFGPPAVDQPGSDLDSDTQDAPGAGADNLLDEYGVRVLPDYFYEPWYYNTYGVGARPLPDYAPPGYEPRDYQDAPGVPEYSRITPPPRPPAGDAGLVVTRGMYPNSFLIPGMNTSFRMRGFVRLMALNDFEPIGVTDAFVTNSIPVPQESGQNFNMSARMSRIGFETWTPTNYCDWNVHTLIEGDFFNGPAQAAGGGGNPFRLRHAFFDFGYFRFGQQNSVFMDGTNWPSLVDFQGPNSWANQRQPSARVTLPLPFDEGLYWAASMERPFSDITTNSLGASVQDVPDFATHIRYEADVGHLQFGALARTIGYEPTGETVTRRFGGGVNGNIVFHPWAIVMGTDPVHEPDPSGLTRSRILLQCNWGPGLGRYMNDLAGQGLDGQVNPITGEFDLVEALGWNASYEHWYNSSWLSNFTFANVKVDDNVDQPGSTYEAARYVAGSLWWIPIPRLSLGIEYLYGQRANFDGDDANAQRLNGMFQYNF